MQTKMTTKGRPDLPLTELTSIAILDGRNRSDIQELAPHVSEFNLIRTRFSIEANYLIALSNAGVLRHLSTKEKQKLATFTKSINLENAMQVKKIEEDIQHDVKAIERSFRLMLKGRSLKDATELVHLGLTSEDINNLAYRLILKRATDQVLIPSLDNLIDDLVAKADKYKGIPMLARTHGQAAIPTTVGKEFVVFATRLNKEVRDLPQRQLFGKLTGASGNLNALKFAYPEINWLEFSKDFVKSFGFDVNLVTTQINPYEDMIAFFQNYQRINNILTDLVQDMWRYISDDWFEQKVKQDKVGSSTMPQKVNPIQFENSEGNLGKANALLEYFTRKLGSSRLQRDLSDSTVIRDMGVPLGYSLLAYKNILKGLAKIRLNLDKISEDLNENWAILSEAAQTLMRKLRVTDPYSIMASLTQGRRIGEAEWKEIVARLPISEKDKKILQDITPGDYTGYALRITNMAIGEIKSSREK